MNSPQLEKLFQEAWNESAVGPAGLDLEVDLLLLRDFSDEREEFQILFDLADEAIQNPEAEKRYVEQIAKRESRIIKSGELAEQLAKVESALKLPQFSLRRGGPKVTSKDESALVSGAIEPAKRIVPPPGRIRLRAELFDLVYQFVMALAFTISFAWFTEPSMREDLLAPTSMETPEAICFGALFLSALLLLLVLYPLFSGAQSTAQKFFGLELLTKKGRKPSQRSLLKRSLLCPLSIIVLPFRPRKPSLADQLSELVLSVIPKERDPSLES